MSFPNSSPIPGRLLLFVGAVAALRIVPAMGTELRLPDGFTISHFADDSLAHDIHSMTIDSHGRTVVAGPGYIKVLHDDDDDGKADRTTLYSDIPKSGAHGMYFDGADLICTGDHALMKLSDTDGDGRADGEPDIWASLGQGEHGANGIVKGPDGWYYVACGNAAGVSEELINSSRSPVREPRFGTVLRVSPDGKQFEVYAHGFRNPYDLTFGPRGRLFMVDSDNERDHHLPWYKPTCLFDVGQGLQHGWLQKGSDPTWNRPPYFMDSVGRVCEFGRGSPTGIECYRHRQFPVKYRGGIFAACWTLGRIYFVPLQQSGSTFSSEWELFLEATGTDGFAPVDLAVGPAGDLVVAIGGRGTRGGVFRIRYEEGGSAHLPGSQQSGLDRVLFADQPLASWSRARWEPEAEELSPNEIRSAIFQHGIPLQAKIQALDSLALIRDEQRNADLLHVAELLDAELTSYAAWIFSRARNSIDGESYALLASLTFDHDPKVARAAWEALATLNASVLKKLKKLPRLNLQGGLTHADRRVRAMAAQYAQRAGRAQFDINDLRGPRLHRLSLELVSNGDLFDPEVVQSAASNAIELLATSANPPREISQQDQLDTIRQLQFALGDVNGFADMPETYRGYTSRQDSHAAAFLSDKGLVKEITNCFPSADPLVNRELARLFGIVRADIPGLLEKTASFWTYQSEPSEDIQYLIVASLLRTDRTADVTRKTAAALVNLHHKMKSKGYYPSRNWPLRMGEVFEELCRRDPQLPEALIEDPSFGLAEHSLFVKRMPDRWRLPSARKLLRHVQSSADRDEWTSELVETLAILPDEELFPQLRPHWENPRLSGAITRILAREPSMEDRARFVASLSSIQPQVITASCKSLCQLPAAPDSDDFLIAMRALKRHSSAEGSETVCWNLDALLKHWTNAEVRKSETENYSVTFTAWLDWFELHGSEVAAGMAATSDADWQGRLANIDLESGDSIHGRMVFEKRQCHGCHASSNRLGPSLDGVTVRMSPDALFTAIVDPNRDVAPAYQTRTVITASGGVYQGLQVYESPESTLLQTGPNEIIRAAGEEILSNNASDQSLMPGGLLDGCSDVEIADLYAYLRTLKAR